MDVCQPCTLYSGRRIDRGRGVKTNVREGYKWSQDDDIDALSLNDERALAVAKTFIRLIEGRYDVRVPWRRDVLALHDNKGMTRNRARILRKRLLKIEELKRSYVATMQAHMDKGYVSEVELS